MQQTGVASGRASPSRCHHCHGGGEGESGGGGGGGDGAVVVVVAAVAGGPGAGGGVRVELAPVVGPAQAGDGLVHLALRDLVRSGVDRGGPVKKGKEDKNLDKVFLTNFFFFRFPKKKGTITLLIQSETNKL